jgi:hypothetical protein
MFHPEGIQGILQALVLGLETGFRWIVHDLANEAQAGVSQGQYAIVHG